MMDSLKSELLIAEKRRVRHELKQIRDSICAERREQAEQALNLELPHLLASYSHILSFWSFGREISTYRLNQHLAVRSALYLPRVTPSGLSIHIVEDLDTLIQHPYGFYEPDPRYCASVSIGDIEAILVPGLGFDTQGHRLGYGKGLYDQLLSSVHHAPSYGLGFKEQLIDSLPVEPHDVTLDFLMIY